MLLAALQRITIGFNPTNHKLLTRYSSHNFVVMSIYQIALQLGIVK